MSADDDMDSEVEGGGGGGLAGMMLARMRSPSPVPERQASRPRRVNSAARAARDRREDVPGGGAGAADGSGGRLLDMADAALRSEHAYRLKRLRDQQPLAPPQPPQAEEQYVFYSHCWWCDYGFAPYDASNDDGSYGYALVTKKIDDEYGQPGISKESLAAACATLANMHIHLPALRASQATHQPCRVPRFEPQIFLYHFDNCMFTHPVAGAYMALESAHRHVLVSRHHLYNNKGEYDVRQMAEARQSNDAFARHHATWRAIVEARGKKSEIHLDPAHMTGLGNMKRLQPYLVTAADTLGGATAAGSAAEQALQERRPAFGAANTLATRAAQMAELSDSTNSSDDEEAG